MIGTTPRAGHGCLIHGGGPTGAGRVFGRSGTYRPVTRCAIVRGMTIFDDLAAEQERLEGILSGLDLAQWASPSGASGWTIADVVLHLAQSEEGVHATVTHKPLRARLGVVAETTTRGRRERAGGRRARPRRV